MNTFHNEKKEEEKIKMYQDEKSDEMNGGGGLLKQPSKNILFPKTLRLTEESNMHKSFGNKSKTDFHTTIDDFKSNIGKNKGKRQ